MLPKQPLIRAVSTQAASAAPKAPAKGQGTHGVKDRGGRVCDRANKRVDCLSQDPGTNSLFLACDESAERYSISSRFTLYIVGTASRALHRWPLPSRCHIWDPNNTKQLQEASVTRCERSEGMCEAMDDEGSYV